MMIRINEYLEKILSRCKRCNESTLHIIELTKIYAIGPSKCKELQEKHGIVTIKDLKININKIIQLLIISRQ